MQCGESRTEAESQRRLLGLQYSISMLPRRCRRSGFIVSGNRPRQTSFLPRPRLPPDVVPAGYVSTEVAATIRTLALFAISELSFRSNLANRDRDVPFGLLSVKSYRFAVRRLFLQRAKDRFQQIRGARHRIFANALFFRGNHDEEPIHGLAGHIGIEIERLRVQERAGETGFLRELFVGCRDAGPGEYRLTGWALSPSGLELAVLQATVVPMDAPFGSGTTQDTTFMAMPPWSAPGVWTAFDSGIITAPADTKSIFVLLALDDFGNTQSSASVYLDNLSLVQVPEPGSMTLLGLGLLGVSIHARSSGGRRGER